MELKEFVKVAIKDIANAVKESEEELGHLVTIAKDGNNKSVEFEIAVTSESQNSKKGGIRVMQFLGGEMGSDYKNASISRIKFGVFVSNEIKE